MTVTDYDETIYTKMFKGSENEIKVPMFINAACVLFLIKPLWVKNKSLINLFMDFFYLLIVVWSIY